MVAHSLQCLYSKLVKKDNVCGKVLKDFQSLKDFIGDSRFWPLRKVTCFMV